MALTEQQVKNWLINNIDRSQVAANMQLFVDCVNDIDSLTQDSQPVELLNTLNLIRYGCNQMTDTFCKPLWSEMRKYDYEVIDEMCSLCPIWERCTQNPAVHYEGNLYYHIVQLMIILRKLKRMSTEERTEYLADFRNRNKIREQIIGVKNTKTQAQWFQNVADTWSN